MHFLKDEQNKNPLDYYGLRQAAVKQELMPSYRNITKPTRDIQASNRSHSLSKEDLNSSYNNRLLTSQKQIMLLEKQLQQCQFQRQANIVYNKQFREIGRALGNQNMEFDQIKQRIEDLILQAPQPQIHHHQGQNVETYHTKIFKQQIEALQRQLQIKNHTLSQLGQKKRYSQQKSWNDYTTNCRSFKDHPQYKQYTNKIQALQSQIRQLKYSEDNSQNYRLQSQILKLKKQEQSYQFKIQSLQSKIQTLKQQINFIKNKQQSLSLSLTKVDTEAKLLYKGVQISSTTLLKQLTHRDQEIQNQNYYLRDLQQKFQRQERKSAERDMSQTIVGKNIRQAQQKIYLLQQDKRKSQNQIRSLRFDLQSKKLQIKSNQARLQQYQTKIISLNSHNVELEQKYSKNSNNDFQLNELRTRIKQEQSQIVKLGQYIDKKDAQIQAFKLKYQTIQKQKSNLQVQYKQLSDIYSSFSNFKNQYQKVNALLQTTKNQKYQLSRKYQQLTINYQESNKTIQNLEKRYTEINQIYQQVRQKYVQSTNQNNQNIKKLTSSRDGKEQNQIKSYKNTILTLENKLQNQIQQNQTLSNQITRLKYSLDQLAKTMNTHNNLQIETSNNRNYLARTAQISFINNNQSQVNANSSINIRNNQLRSMQKIQNNVSNVDQTYGNNSILNTNKQYYQFQYFNKNSRENKIQEGSRYQHQQLHQSPQKSSQVQYRHSSNKNQYETWIISLQERIKHLQQEVIPQFQKDKLLLKAKIQSMQQQIDDLNSKIASKNQASSVNKYSGSFGRATNQRFNGYQLQNEGIKTSNIQINLNSSTQSKRQNSKNIHFLNCSRLFQQFQSQIKANYSIFNDYYQSFKNKMLSYILTIDTKINLQINYSKKQYLEDYQAEQISKLTKKSYIQDQKHCVDYSGSDLKYEKKSQNIKIKQQDLRRQSNYSQKSNQNKEESAKNSRSHSDVNSNQNNQSHDQLSRKILNQKGSKQSENQLSKLSENIPSVKKQSQSKIQKSDEQKKQWGRGHTSHFQERKAINSQSNNGIKRQDRKQENRSIHEKIKDLMEVQKQKQDSQSKIQSNILPQYSNKNRKQVITAKLISTNVQVPQTPMRIIQNNGIKALSTILSNNSHISNSSGLYVNTSLQNQNQNLYKQNNKESSISHQKRQNSSKSISNRPSSRISINYGNTSKVIYTGRSSFANDISSPISPIKSDHGSILSKPSFTAVVAPQYPPTRRVETISRKSSLAEQKKSVTEQNSFSKQLNRENMIIGRQNYQIGYQEGLPIYSSKQVIGRKQSNSSKNIIFNQLKSSRVSQNKREQVKSPKNSVIQKLMRQTVVNDEYYPVNQQFDKQMYRQTTMGTMPVYQQTNISNANRLQSTNGFFNQNRQSSNVNNLKSIYYSQSPSQQVPVSPRDKRQSNNNSNGVFMHKNLASSNVRQRFQNPQNSNISQNMQNTQNSQNKLVQNQSFTQSQDSGIDVLQYDKGFNCCRN